MSRNVRIQQRTSAKQLAFMLGAEVGGGELWIAQQVGRFIIAQ